MKSSMNKLSIYFTISSEVLIGKLILEDNNGVYENWYNPNFRNVSEDWFVVQKMNIKSKQLAQLIFESLKLRYVSQADI